jgi:hypothetical protein
MLLSVGSIANQGEHKLDSVEEYLPKKSAFGTE